MCSPWWHPSLETSTHHLPLTRSSSLIDSSIKVTPPPLNQHKIPDTKQNLLPALHRGQGEASTIWYGCREYNDIINEKMAMVL